MTLNNLQAKNIVSEDQLIQTSQETINWKDKVFSDPTKTINVATLFSGIGAIEQSLKRLKLNHKIVFAGDIDKNCKASYFANYQLDEKDWHDDVTEGSPCQTFSMVGKRLGLEDTRGTLFYDFARVVNECKPKVFIYENVKGLLNHDEGKTWLVVQSVFKELGYKIHSKTLNSKDYGIPQHRERIFVVGFKNKKETFEFPEKTPLEHSMQDFLEDYIDSKYYLKAKGVKFVTSTWNKKKKYTQINGNVALCQKANQQFNWHGDFVFEEVNDSVQFDDFIFSVNDVEEKYYLSTKVKNYVLAGGTKNFKTGNATDLQVARPLVDVLIALLKEMDITRFGR